ncbi:mechanosensitive ion channel family protein [Polyangium aurulentum]|uniref:mechanosensitive ion channel family protein n=1 Tax=Polyangium aurulentum TaxID=2567896 RepID=UPI0010AEA31D|nr:mechanosensitive ion channel family protein [Polyangium aurulentum]UQA55531.1 mechanosensitive ion channel family protein [Polyangium aurulentum]
MNDQIKHYADAAVLLGMSIGLKILGALAVWIGGRIVIRAVLKLLDRSAAARKLDDTISRYLHSAANALLNILLIITVLGVFGVETMTFAGVLAAAGVAVGLAWSGLLSNWASGIFMVVLRPFKVGDVISVAGTTGLVHSIGLFVTALDTGDGVRTYIGNSKIFSDTIQNFSENPTRRVDLLAQLPNEADVPKAIATLQAALAANPKVLKDPAPVVDILQFTLAGPVLAVRPFCRNEHYLDVVFATNLAIHTELGKLGFPVAANPVMVTQPLAPPAGRNLVTGSLQS